MIEKILKYNEYLNKINEADENEEEAETEEEDDNKSDFEEAELDSDDEEIDDEEEGEENQFNETPEHYINSALKKIERRILSYFNAEENSSKLSSENIQLVSSNITKMPMFFTLKIKFQDQDYLYHLMIRIPLEEGMPEKEDVDMDTDMVEYCSVDFKKYSSEGDYIGEIDKKKEKCDDIDEEYIIGLNVELDNEFGITSNDLKIEYE